MSQEPTAADAPARAPARIVDAHHHLFDLDLRPRGWLHPEEPVPDAVTSLLGDVAPLRRSYRLDDYLADALPANVVKSVHVEVERHDDPLAETRWLQSLADEHGFPHGIVAYAPLEDPAVGELLQEHVRFPNVRGIRQVLNYEDEPALRFTSRPLLRDPAWRRGFSLLASRGLSFDLHVWPSQLAEAAALAREFPETQVVLDHAGVPRERDEAGLAAWRRGLAELAGQPNVAAKVSGLGMVDHTWTLESIRPLVTGVLEAFGVERCLFGSNFPVDGLYRDFEGVVAACAAIASELGLSEGELDALFAANAERVYRL